MEQEAWQVLIVEDDQRLAELTREYLESNGLRVSIEGNGALAAERIIAEQPDLVILDLMLPGEDGLSICRKVRDRYDGPILMLTARTDDMDQVLGLDTGADDYVCKPVRPRLLLARVQALLRRSEPPQAVVPERRLQFGPLVVDNALREAWLHENGIERPLLPGWHCSQSPQRHRRSRPARTRRHLSRLIDRQQNAAGP